MIQFDLSGRTAVVTGGAKGIGLGIAQRLAAAGASIAIWDQNPNPVQHGTASNLAVDFARIETVDVTDGESVQQALARTLAQVGHIDILVNNAGVSGPTVPTWEYPLEAWQKVLDVDLGQVKK